MKKTISCLITISLVLSMCMPVFAASTAPTMEEYEVLDAAVRAARTDEEATVAMYNLLDFFDRVENSQANGVMPRATETYPSIIDSYIDMISCSVSTGTATFNYELVSLVPSGASLTLGYEYPASTRITGGSFTPGSTLGTYSRSINTGNCACSIQLVGSFLARDFRATKVYKETYQYGFTGTKYSYKTITQSDIAERSIALTIAGITGMLSLEGAIGRFIVYLAGITGIASIYDELPSLRVGQYYVTMSWFSGGKMYTNLRIWNSVNAYNNNEETLYNKTSQITLPTF
ncbi:MAG: hypothetical protein U0L92_05905 [Clostridia bacterium]|nr:hypothetical protein [Clostridia bacterium]